MLKKILNKIHFFINIGNERSVKAKKNIILSFIFKGINILIQLMMVPLLLNYLDKQEYGIWLVISSIVMWFAFFDVGLGNGLRNKLTEALAKKNIKQAKEYVSTAYATISIIFLFLILIFIIVNPHLDWTKILNSSVKSNQEFILITYWFFTPILLHFILILLKNVIYANQQPALINLLNVLSNLLSFIAIYVLTKNTESSLLYVSILFSVSRLFVPLLFNIYLFSKEYKELKPEIKSIRWSLNRDLLSLGGKFFIIQITAVIIFSSTNFLIAQIANPASVVEYNIIYKYFSVLLMIFSIITVPFWSAFTDALAQNDIRWIKKSMKKLTLISYIFALGAILMFFSSKLVFSFWVGNSLKFSTSLIMLVAILIVNNLLASPYITFINGSGKINLQFYYSIYSLICFFFYVIFFGKDLHLGASGVVIAILIINVPASIIWFFQYKHIINSMTKNMKNIYPIQKQKRSNN